MKKILVALLFTSTAFAQDITPKQVIEKYIDAIGGTEKIADIKDLTMEISGEVMGQEMLIEYIKKTPNKFIMVQNMGGMEQSKAIFDGEKAVTYVQGNEIPMGEEQIESLKGQSQMVAEQAYLADESKLSLEANEEIEGEDCYVLVMDADQTKIKEFYSVATGLKVMQEIEMPQATVIIYPQEYKAYNGVLFPTVMKQEVMGMSMEMKVTKLLINSGVADSEFEIK